MSSYIELFHTFPYLLFCCLGIATGALAIEFLHHVDGAYQL